ALRLLIKRAQRLDLVAKELNTDGPGQGRRKEVDDAPTMAELPRLFYFRYWLVAKVVKVLQHQREVNLLPGLQIVKRCGEFLRWYNRLCQHPRGTDDDSPAFTVRQADQRVHALLRGGGIAD